MKNKDLSGKYDKIYKKGAYSTFFTFNFFPGEKLIIEMLPNWNGLDVIDIGCGEGRLAAMLNFAAARHVDAIDYSEEAIKIAKESINLENVDFKCSDFKIIKKKYDVITMNGVLEHFDHPFEDLKYMVDNMLNDNGCVITTSPSFLNPRGYVWMTLQLLLNVPMSLSDLHFLCPFDFQEFCENNGYKLEFKSTDQDWGGGYRTIIDFKNRLPNALRDANLSTENVENFLFWLEKAVGYYETNDYTGATVAYKISKN